MHPDADVRATREGDVAPRVLTPDVEPIRVGEGAGIPVGRGDRHRHEVALRDRRSAELQLTRGVAVDRRRGGLEPQRLLDRSAQQRAVLAYERQLVVVGEQVQQRVADHALGGLDAAEQEHGLV